VAAVGAISREALMKSLAANVPRAVLESNRAACESGLSATGEAIEGGVHV
jgi:hypothetical protein